MKKAYSLVEILVVMTIIALLMGLGTAGLIQLRRSMEADQAGKNLIGILKESQSMAKNNTLDANLVATQPSVVISNIFGVKLRFDGLHVWRSICKRPFDGQWDQNTLADCTTEVNLQPESFANIELIPQKKDAWYNTMNCNILLIENLTNKFFLFKTGGIPPFMFISAPGAPPEVLKCDVVIKIHDSNDIFNKLVIDAYNSNFEIQPY